MPKTVVRVGPADHGRRMRLAEFASAEGQPGYRYELSRGVVTVVDVPNSATSRRSMKYDINCLYTAPAHPGQITTLAAGGECKILLGEEESERHPDIAVYKSPPAAEENLWANWIPELVVEVVSPGSEHRDYVEKRQEYLSFGVREYRIVDADKGEVLVLRRRGRAWTERTVRPPEVYATKVLPGFEFHCAAVFEAARAVGG